MDYHDIIDNIANGIYKIIDKKGRSAIWTTFGEVQREDGHILVNLVCCRLCRNIFKFNGKQTSNLIRHKCHANKRDVFKSLNESKGKGKSKAQEARTESDDEEEFKWTNDDDGGIVSDANVSKQKVALKTLPRRGNVQSDEEEEECKWSNDDDDRVQLEWRKQSTQPPPSPAIKKTKSNDKNEELFDSDESQDLQDEASVHRRINKLIDRGEYKIVARKNGKSKIWTLFGEIQREDGNIVKNVVFCRVCKRILKFNGAQTSNLNRHRCYASAKDDFISLNGSTPKAKQKSCPQELPAQSEDEEECKWENDDDDSNISNAIESRQNLPLPVQTRNSSKRQTDDDKEFQWSNDDDDPLQVQKKSSPLPVAAKKLKTLAPAYDLNEEMIIFSRELAASQGNMVDNYEKSNDSKDEASVYADAWAFTYRKMTIPQQIYAKQAIDEILTRGRLQELKFNYLSSCQPNSAATNDSRSNNTN